MAQDAQKIWQQVHDGLRAFVSKRVANEAEVEDILQEVFLRMHRKLDSLKDPRRVVSWLFQITRHAIIDHYRKPARRREMPAGLSADLDTDHPVPVPPVTDESAVAGRLSAGGHARRAGRPDTASGCQTAGPLSVRDEVPRAAGPPAIEGYARSLLRDST